MHTDRRRMEMLKEIQEYAFTALELNLYLDTHPGDNRALEQFNQVSGELTRKVEKYEECYGPLLNYGYSGGSGSHWRWVEEPWPWEM